MKKIISYIIAVMMVFSLMPYTAFAETSGGETANAAIFNKDMTIGQSEEINLDLFIRSEVTVESEDSSIANCAVMGTALILSSGSAIYRSTIKIMPVKIGTTLVTVKSNGEVKATYRINVMAVEQSLESHIGEKPVIEYVSYFDGEITNTNTENVTATVISKTERTSTQTVNGLPVIEEQYVYKIEIEYNELGEFEFSLIGKNSGEFYKISANVTDHKWGDGYIVDVEPTCTAEGSQSIHCELCDAVKETIFLPVTDHEYGEWIIDTPATCTAEGTQHKKCLHCEDIVESSLEKTAHDYDWIIDTPASEQAPGKKHEECTACGDVRNADTEIEQLTHTHKMINIAAVAPTCTKAGNITYYSCTECGGIFSDMAGNYALTEEEIILEATMHKFGPWIIEIPATCEAPGIWTKECEKCGEITTLEASALGHTIIADPQVEATCTADGLTAGSHCNTCQTVFVPQNVIPATGHIYETDWVYDINGHWHQCECGEKSEVVPHIFEWVVDEEPTQETTGLKHEECTVCKAVRNKNTLIDQLGHVHEMIKTEARAATCLATGNIEYYHCTVCGNYYKDAAAGSMIKREETIIPAAGHIYSEWIKMNPSTCTHKGYEFTSCMNCGVAEIREIPLKEHSLKYSRIEPTCTEPGANVTECKKCSYEISDAIPATGHSEVVVPAVAETCTVDGSTEGIKCSKCNTYIIEPSVIPATGHNYGAWIIDAQGTCSAAGSMHRECSTCKEKEIMVIEKTEHIPVVLPAVTATCISTGLTQGIGCGICGEVILVQGEVPLGNHTWKTNYTVDKTANIYRAGSISCHCKLCNVIRKESIKKVPRIKKTTAASLIYNGKTRTPVITVVDYSGNQLKRGIDFTVTYKNYAGTKTVKPKNVGTYKAVVKFRGKYSGSVIKTFKIKPRSTSITKLTRPAKKQFKVTWTKRTEQVTGYQLRYSTKQNMSGAKFITIANSKTVSRVIKGLKSNKKYHVQIRTYKTVNGQKYYSAWSKKKSVVTK